MCTGKRLALLALLCLPAGTWAADGIVKVVSSHPVAATMDRLEAIAKQKGMTIFARIDHARGAASVGAEMRPTEVLIFGNPKGGTPFMACAQSIGIDLPLKVLVWRDEQGKVWLGYNDPAWIAARHGAGDCAAARKIKQALESFAAAATAP